MEVINKIILGIVQGITEIVPVSSSGHLILLSEFLEIETDLAFLTYLHLMTGLAIIWGFWPEIRYVFNSKSKNYLLKLIFMGLIPAAMVGTLAHGYIQDFLHNAFVVITSLILFGILMILTDVFLSKKAYIEKLEGIKGKNALIIGLAQIIALIPGTSRSGITITSAVVTGIKKDVAVAFSFLIGLPLIIGAFFFEVVKNRHSLDTMFKGENLIGGLAAFIFAYFTILIFKKFLHTKFLLAFGIYRIVLGAIMAILLLII